MTAKQHFIYFLKQHHVYEKFMVKFKKDKSAPRKFSDYAENTSPSNYMVFAFYWDNPIWRDLDIRWDNYIRQLTEQDKKKPLYANNTFRISKSILTSM